MYQTQITSVGSALVTLASGAATIINEDTYIPLGVFCSVCVFVCVMVWRASSEVKGVRDDLKLIRTEVKAEINLLDYKIKQLEKKNQ